MGRIREGATCNAEGFRGLTYGGQLLLIGGWLQVISAFIEVYGLTIEYNLDQI